MLKIQRQTHVLAIKVWVLETERVDGFKSQDLWEEQLFENTKEQTELTALFLFDRPTAPVCILLAYHE